MSDRTDLVERIKSALANADECPWLPDLTADLVKTGWRDLYKESGLSPFNYGTSRVIARSVHAHRNLVGHLSTSLAVEVIDEGLVSYYKDAGIEFYTAKEITSANLLGCIEYAMNLIKRVPNLHATVAALVSSVHLIKPQDDDYDVSFSEPHIPFSIFVSVPENRSLTKELRIAEAIVHEAMHLQLTLIDGVVPLVIETSKKTYSPWRGGYRNLGGVLHALYVFRVIDRFLEYLLSIDSYPAAQLIYLRGRIAEIEEQIRTVQTLYRSSELTMDGASFVRRLIHNSALA